MTWLWWHSGYNVGFTLSRSRTVWPDEGIKSCLISPQNCTKKVDTHFLHKSDIIRNNPKSHHNISATFVTQFVAKNLQRFAQAGHTGHGFEWKCKSKVVKACWKPNLIPTTSLWHSG